MQFPLERIRSWSDGALGLNRSTLDGYLGETSPRNKKVFDASPLRKSIPNHLAPDTDLARFLFSQSRGRCQQWYVTTIAEFNNAFGVVGINQAVYRWEEIEIILPEIGDGVVTVPLEPTYTLNNIRRERGWFGRKLLEFTGYRIGTTVTRGVPYKGGDVQTTIEGVQHKTLLRASYSGKGTSLDVYVDTRTIESTAQHLVRLRGTVSLGEEPLLEVTELTVGNESYIAPGRFSTDKEDGSRQVVCYDESGAVQYREIHQPGNGKIEVPEAELTTNIAQKTTKLADAANIRLLL